MKAIFVAYNQAYNQEIVEVLQAFGQRGYTKWEDVGGQGSVDGEPHLGSHALFSAVPDELAAPVLAALKEKDEKYKDLGLRAYSWTIEQSI